MIVKLSLHLKWYYPIMPAIFLPQNEDFFLHDFTLIASVLGENIIAMEKAGNISQLKLRNLLNARSLE